MADLCNIQYILYREAVSVNMLLSNTLLMRCSYRIIGDLSLRALKVNRDQYLLGKEVEQEESRVVTDIDMEFLRPYATTQLDRDAFLSSHSFDVSLCSNSLTIQTWTVAAWVLFVFSIS